MHRSLPLALLVAAASTLAACSSPSRSTGPAPGPGQASNAPSAAASTAPAAAVGTDSTTYHRDAARTGLTPGTATPGRLTPAWRAGLDGPVYAQPLVVGRTVVAATENNTLYGLDADTGAVRWHTHVGDAVPQSRLPCGNIDPLGITGTPVYDPASGWVFAVAELGTPGIHHDLVAVDVRTGQQRLSRTVDLPGTDPAAQQQRAGLALAGGRVVVAMGGLYGDCGDYGGYVVATSTGESGALASYRVPTPRKGGIWAPSGPAVDGAGHVFVSVGNGERTSDPYDGSDSVVELDGALRQVSFFAPKQWAEENAGDVDLGSTGPVLLGGGRVVAAGKNGRMYVLDAGRLGGIGGAAGQAKVCRAYGGSAADGDQVFLPCADGIRQVTVDGTALRKGWHASENVAGSPVVGGGAVWAVDAPGGRLYALDESTGKRRAEVEVGETSRFATPALWGDRIFVPTLAGVSAVAIR